MRFGNREGGVFFVEGEEEVVAALFARYSRSPLGLREQYEAMAAEGAAPPASYADEGGDQGPGGVASAELRARSASLHEKYVIGYGHGSVAEHAVAHLGLEGISIVAAKALEERRIGLAYTEKSTRYVKFGSGAMLLDAAVPERHRAAYRGSCLRLMGVYLRLADRLEASIQAARPDVPAASRRAKALDMLRGLLPACTLTNVGVTGNARALSHAVRSMRGSSLPEVRSLADAVERQASHVVPTLLRRTGADEFAAAARSRVAEAAADCGGGSLAASLGSPPRAGLVMEHEVSLAWAHRASHYDVASDILSWTGNADPWAVGESSAPLSPEDSRRVIDAYLGGRPDRGRVGRGLEGGRISWVVTCDYGAWRDLQRHRIVSATTPTLGTGLGFWRSPELDALGIGDEFDAEVERAGHVAMDIAESDPEAAQYATPMAYRVRWRVDMSLRELFHVIELRSARGGHESYRAVAHRMASAFVRACPWAAPHLRVDLASYEFARQ